MADPLRSTDPRTIGRYRTLKRLGQGGMGSVFLAEDPAGRLVAVKVIRPEFAHEPEFRARFRSEVNRAREVPPFCTAEVLDADPDHVTPYLVVEYVDGPSLAEVVAEQGALTGGSLHGVAVGVGAALAAIHGAGVIHRDLKPRNVLFALGTPKVIDFGIARPLEPTSFHTRAEEVVGTLAYMAPERLDPETDRLLTPAVDVFAWGAVVTYAGTGRSPFAGDSPAVTAARILTQPPRLHDLPPYLAELVIAALEKEPENRPTATELLDRLLVTGGPSAPPLPPDLQRSAEAAQQSGRYHTGPRKRPGRGRMLGVIAAVTATAVGVAVGAGTLLRQAPSPDNPTVAVSSPARPSTPAVPVISGPAIFDSLAKDSVYNAGPGCAYKSGLRAVAKGPAGETRCSDFLGTVYPPSQNVTVRATLNDTDSCAAVWFRAASETEDAGPPDAYRVAVCADRVTLTSYTGQAGETTIITEKRATTTGTAHPIQLVVDEDEATVSIDGEPALSGPLTENSLVSGRVMFGSVAPSGSRSVVTFSDAELRSGVDPAAPAAPGFRTGDAAFTARTYMVYNDGRVAILEQMDVLTGTEYCDRLGLVSTSPKCADDFVTVPSRIKVSLPIAAKPKYFDYDANPKKCTDPQTRVATCRVSFSEFATVSDSTKDQQVFVTVKGGEVVSVAGLNLD
ncbi:serine/threonine protein kinase [Actinoplanes derwentensis]|uniref:serine/threonine protein kinase n=1 Tax=Actinoplanes derwentensis TaxID=113562 RepID=UPI000B831488|nr:serine/threonine-protein kinase [Actinoplanes derwentensis]